jgi:hypothetical protein
MTDNDIDIEVRLHSALGELTQTVPLVRPDAPRPRTAIDGSFDLGGSTRTGEFKDAEGNSGIRHGPTWVAPKLLVMSVCVALLVIALALTGLSHVLKQKHSNSVSISATTTVPAPTTLATSPPSTLPVGPPCDKEAITAAADRKSPGVTVSEFECAGNFAYAFVEIPPPPAPSTASGYEATFLFIANGAEWQWADRGVYCPSVPASIYRNACQTN